MNALWRLDPNYSFSDYRIDIIHQGTGEEKHYHVHKTVLVFGEQKSEYFAGLLQSGCHFAETDHVRIKLEGAAVRAFPHFLDFIYTGDYHDVAAAETNVSLIHLGNYFGVPALVTIAKKFLTHHLCTENLHHSLPSLFKFQNDDGVQGILQIAQHLIVDAILERRHELCGLVLLLNDVGFVTEALDLCNSLITARNRITKTEEFSPSILVTQLLDVQKEHMCFEDVEQISDSLSPTTICPKTALELLEIGTDCFDSKDEINSLQAKCFEILLSSQEIHMRTEQVFAKLSHQQLLVLLTRWLSEPRVPAKDSTIFRSEEEIIPYHHVKVISMIPELSGSLRLCRTKHERANTDEIWYWRNGQWNGENVVFIIIHEAGKWMFGYRNKSPGIYILFTANSIDDMESQVPPAWGWQSVTNANVQTDSRFCKLDYSIKSKVPIFLQFSTEALPCTMVDI